MYTDSSLLIDDAAAAAARMAKDGYLWLPGLLPRDVVTRLHELLARHVQAAGWLREGTDPRACVADPARACVDPEPEYLGVIEGFNRLIEYNALSHHPRIVGFLEAMIGETVLVHPKPLPRNIFPALEAYTTPAHQDFPNIQGTEAVYTAWIPLVDCGPEVGGLQVAAGSHQGGVYEFGIGNGAGGIEILEPFDGQWVGGPMKVGDVLLFHSMTVHKGIANRSDKLRMSVDVRYQAVTEPFNPMNADRPYGAPETWEALYDMWPDTPDARRLQYYWERFPLRSKAFDPQWFERRDQLGFEFGARGDPRARSVLLRIAMRDADAAKRARAHALLEQLEAP